MADGGLPEFTTAAWIHVISAELSAVLMLLVMLLLTIRFKKLGQLDGLYVLLGVFSVLGPVSHGLTLATPPATSPAGPHQRLFAASMLLWSLVASIGLMSGRLRAAEIGRAA